jgi:hypothetical protein
VSHVFRARSVNTTIGFVIEDKKVIKARLILVFRVHNDTQGLVTNVRAEQYDSRACSLAPAHFTEEGKEKNHYYAINRESQCNDWLLLCILKLTSSCKL